MKYNVKPSSSVPGAYVVYTKTGNVLVTAWPGIAEATAFTLNALAADDAVYACSTDLMQPYSGPTEGI